MKAIVFIIGAISLIINEENNSRPYFTFDEVDYFTKQTNQDSHIFSLQSKSDKTKEEENLVAILLDGEFSYADTALLKSAEAFEFKKTQLSSDKVKELQKIFNPKSLKANHITFCDPVFNDILIFRYKNKTTGFAKICISCGKIFLAGEDVHSRIHTPEKELERLKSLLKN
jgi:hypothetical protein